jgi:hypothetical protein
VLAVLAGTAAGAGGGLRQDWPFNDGAGAVASNAVAGGNPGVLVNYATPGWNADVPVALTARSGGSLAFSSANAQYVNGGTLGLSATGGVDGVTISCWLKPGVIGPDTRLFSTLRQTATTPHPVGSLRLLSETSGHGTLQVFTGSAWASLTPAGAVKTNQWQHLCLVWLGTQVDAFLNGNRTGMAASRFEFDLDSSGSPVGFGIGAKYLTYGTTYDGKMADLSVWDETLSPLKVRRLASGESPLTVSLAGPAPGVSLYWAFDDGAGALATNSVPGGNTGVLINFNGAGWDADVPAALAERSSGSLAFTSANTNYVDAGPLGLSSTGGVDGATVALWVKPNTIINDMRLWGQLRQTTSTPNPTGAIAFNREPNGRGSLRAFNMASNFWVNITPVGAIVTNEWHHLAFAWCGPRLVTYLNGNPVGGMDVRFEFNRDASDRLMNFGIGAKYQTSLQTYGVAYDGKMDDVAVWGATLSPESIRQLAVGTSPLFVAADNAPTPPEAPLAKYLMDGSVKDSRGKHSGALTGGAIFMSGEGNTPFGYAGNASLQFDGIDDCVTIPDDPSLRPGTKAWTLSLWFKAESADQLGALIAKRKNGQPYTQMSLMVGGTSTGTAGTGKRIHSFVVGNQTSVDRWEVSSVDDFADGGWHHVALVRGSGDWRPVLYIDGHAAAILSNMDAGTRPHAIDCLDPWRIGFDGASAHFAGLIDEVALWDIALSSENIAWLAKHTLADISLKGTLIQVK